jgi:hypothetical protein
MMKAKERESRTQSFTKAIATNNAADRACQIAQWAARFFSSLLGDGSKYSKNTPEN